MYTVKCICILTTIVVQPTGLELNLQGPIV